MLPHYHFIAKAIAHFTLFVNTFYKIKDPYTLMEIGQSVKNAVSGDDEHHEEMDRLPSGLGTDPFPVRDRF